MKDYHINIFYSEEDGGYIADIPDLKACSAFGETPEAERWRFITPGRLIVRDAPLCDRLEITDEDGNVREIMWDDVTTDLPYTEVKMEVAIDIVTAASNPRQMERVPPGALFDCEMLFAVFDPQTVHSTSDMEKQRLHAVLWAMRLLEDDYIGSSGTRGYGKVIFKDVTIKWRPLDYYKEIADEETLVQQVSIEQALQRFEEDIAVKIWHEGATG
ncbi:MAG TPA: type III-A CRISPR-associated RAMP protein Csm3 [Armatimonadetes bacterium]|nr:type III-A CRISPR-associated RAMP protein Csm3 [Armatimonadota bacterium]